MVSRSYLPVRKCSVQLGVWSHIEKSLEDVNRWKGSSEREQRDYHLAIDHVILSALGRCVHCMHTQTEMCDDSRDAKSAKTHLIPIALEVVKWKPEVGKWKPEVGKWKQEVGKWKPEVGKWKPEVGKWKPEVGKWKPEVGRMEAGSRKNGSRK